MIEDYITLKAALFAQFKHAGQKDDDGKDYFLFAVLGDTHKNKEDAQAQLDAIFDLIEYERYGD